MQPLVMDGVRGLPASRQVRSEPIAATPKTPSSQPTPIRHVNRIAFDGVYVPRPMLQPVAVAQSIAAPLPNEALVLPSKPKRWPWIVAMATLAPVIMIATTFLADRPAPNAKPQTAAEASITAPEAAPVVPVAAKPQGPTLQDTLAAFAATQTVPFGVLVKDLKTGEVATLNAHQVFTSASLYKLYVASEVYRRVDTGKLTLGAGAGGDTGLSISQCLTYMITISDNACGEALGTLVGWRNMTSNLKNQGYPDTDLSNQPLKTSASDVAQLLERLYNGTLLSPSSTGQFLGLLKAQKVNNRLPAGLPNGTVIAHKTGDLDGLLHDAGIVYAPKTTYLVTALSGPWPNVAAGPGGFADLSAKLYTYFNK